ncbi:7676_t:CDS:2 [Cetraspora pellucida]|uniref:7676_t:CDS:1 n=1 Tax=Cetraspora pellucida TaxID=1433469 RepID=A0A9N9NMF2_9GLOM|nr:7676_t:CDS:2 [Cetraspora pellucida]
MDHVIITHVLDPRCKLEHLYATLIKVGGYSENQVELFVNNIREKIISYRIKYSNAVKVVEVGEIAKAVETVEIIDHSADDFLFLRRKIERAFSRADFTITSDRASISEETVSSIILLHLWLTESQNKFSPLQDLL